MAFKDLLLDLPSYIDKQTFEIQPDIPQLSYTIFLGPSYRWTYLAQWKLKCVPPKVDLFDKILLQATLSFVPETQGKGWIHLPTLPDIEYEYFIEKKASLSHGEAHEIG